MRQAGRYMPEYQALRERHSLLDLCRTPDLAVEVTLQPIQAFGFDAAILFSDIVVPLRAAGVDLDIVAGVGPVVAQPVRTRADVERIAVLEPDSVAAVAANVAQVGFHATATVRSVLSGSTTSSTSG